MKSHILGLAVLTFALATPLTLVGQSIASAAAPATTCVDQNNGRGCTAEEIRKLCIPIWFSGKPADPTNRVDNFCRETDPNAFN